MSEDMESKGIFFDLQWKTKTGVTRSEEFASIGIWEVDDSSLDWLNFKPYLCQTLGNVENVSISYIDSDGDVIPIDSDCEFQEALKYARRKAAMGQKIILQVEKLDSQPAASGGTELSSSPIYIKSSNFIKERFKLHTSNNEEQNPFRHAVVDGPIRTSGCKAKSKSKAKDVLCPLQGCDTPPLWFKKYMQKMKTEIIAEVTANVNCQVKKMLEEIGHKGPPIVLPSRIHTSSEVTDAWLIAKTKKKISDDDSSDATPKVEIRDNKILKKNEKLLRREKKLDHKKEKLEQKSKKLAERKEREYLSKLRLERAGCKRSHNESLSLKLRETEKALFPRRKSKDLEIADKLASHGLEQPTLGVIVLADEKRTMSVKRGTKFTKVWRVVNSGNIPWMEETNVRLSWGNSGLDPESVVVKCPPLSPGEEGEIAINFTSPDFPGIFESHWHFFSKNTRFGSSLSCIVSVDLIKNSDQEQQTVQGSSAPNSSEFCVVPTSSLEIDGERDVKTLNDNGLCASGVAEEESVSSVNKEVKILKLVSSLDSVQWGSVNERDGAVGKDDDLLSEKKKEAEFESILTDDLSASITSLGSDSDDNFVVVPMPPCFRFDVPLNAAVSMKTETKETTESPNHQYPTPDDISNKNSDAPLITFDLPTQERSVVSDDTGEVISVPVTAPEQPVTAEPIQRQVFEPRNAPSSSTQSREPRIHPSTSEPIHPASSINASRSPSASPRRSPENSRPHENTTPRRNPENSRPKEAKAKPTPNIPNSKASSESHQASSSSNSSGRPIDLMPPVSELWNGARNATRSGLKAAFVAIDNILSNPTVNYGHVHSEQPSQPEPERPLDVEMINGLSKLANMGFCNMHLNEALLRVHSYDISKVVEALLDREDTDFHPVQHV